MLAPVRPQPLTRPRLIADRFRAIAYSAIALGVVVLTVLGALVFHGTTTAPDNRVFVELTQHIGETGRRILLEFTNPLISVLLLLAVGVTAVLRRRPDVLILAAVAPIVATVLTEAVLKPLVGRTLGPQALSSATITGTYPSGHTTIAASTAMVVFVAACQLQLRRASRAVVGVVLLGWVAAVMVGLVRSFYHYATDTIGAVGLSMAVVLSFALLIDRWWARRLTARS